MATPSFRIFGGQELKKNKAFLLHPAGKPLVISVKPKEMAKNLTAISTANGSSLIPMQIELGKGCNGVQEILNRKGKLMPSPCPGLRGQKILLLTNYFKVHVENTKRSLYYYDVSVYRDNGDPVSSSRIRRKVLANLNQTYKSELAERSFAYDGVKSFYTVGPLPNNNLEFIVVLDHVSMKRSGSLSSDGNLPGNDQKRQRLASSSKTFKVILRFVATISIQGLIDSLSKQGAGNVEILQVLDTALLQHAAKRDGLLICQSFFPNEPKNFVDLGGGVLSCRGFNSSFQTVHGGLYLNFDVSTTTIFQPGPVIDFLISHQNVSDPSKIDWLQDNKTLKNLWIVLAHSRQERGVTGLSKRSCKQEKFLLLPKIGNQDAYCQEMEITVYDYFVKMLGVSLAYSADLPCIDVGKPNHPTYYPIELKVGNGEDLYPRVASWRFKDKTLVEPKRIEHWVVVNFSGYPDIRCLYEELAKAGSKIGIVFKPPVHVFEENPKYKKKPPNVRVEKMFEQIKSRICRGSVDFILCLASDKKPSDIYEIGVQNQCFTSQKLDEKCLSQLLLKINAKLGGLNSKLSAEVTRPIPLVSKVPTMIFGLDVSHSSLPDIPSIAAVVGSRKWPLVSCYRASVRTQPRKVQMIDSLFQPVSEQEDKGSFRNGVSKSQFIHMLNIEMDQIFKACKFLDEKWYPKFTVIVSQRGHHTKLFKAGSKHNVPPGTIVDKKICHLQCNNFFLSPHVTRNGTARPTLYHVLLDEIGFTSDDLQEVVHSLSYVFQRSTNAISEVAPIRYAHLAAAQMSDLMKFDETWKVYPSYGVATESRHTSLPELPKLHKNVRASMFFC